MPLLSWDRVLPRSYSFLPARSGCWQNLFRSLKSLDTNIRKGAENGDRHSRAKNGDGLAGCAGKRGGEGWTEATSPTAAESAKLCGTLLVTGERNGSLRERIITLINYFAGAARKETPLTGRSPSPFRFQPAFVSSVSLPDEFSLSSFDLLRTLDRSSAAKRRYFVRERARENSRQNRVKRRN